MGIVVVLVIVVVAAGVFVMFNPFPSKTPQPPSQPTSATLSIQTLVPTNTLYGSQVDVKEIATSQGQAAVNPKLTLSVSLGNDTIYTNSQPINLASPFTQDYTVTLMDPNSVIQPSASAATIQSTLSADNGNAALNTTSIPLWEPSATLKVDLPNSCFVGICNPTQPTPLKAGTYLFNSATVQYIGTQTQTFQVAVGVVVGAQTTPYFQMNKQLTQSYSYNGNTVWIAGSDTIDLAHPLWNVPTSPTEFTVLTGGIAGAQISFNIVLYLVVGNGHYLPLSTIPETYQVNQS